jgi:hypothetical protein
VTEHERACGRAQGLCEDCARAGHRTHGVPCAGQVGIDKGGGVIAHGRVLTPWRTRPRSHRPFEPFRVHFISVSLYKTSHGVSKSK